MNRSTRVVRRPRRAWPPTARTAAAIVATASLALPMAAAQFAGGTPGAHLAVRGGDSRVRKVVLAVVLALVVKLGYDLAGTV